MRKPSGFTLVELLIVIIILGFLTALISGNYMNSLQRGRDARRKNDLAQIQRALESYYEDNRAYPAVAPPFGSRYCSSPSCNANDKIYMVHTPSDPDSTDTYTYIADPTNSQYYYLLSCIENYVNDHGPGVSSTGYCSAPAPADCGTAPTCGSCGTCKYFVGSSNAIPLPTP